VLPGHPKHPDYVAPVEEATPVEVAAAVEEAAPVEAEDDYSGVEFVEEGAIGADVEVPPTPEPAAPTPSPPAPAAGAIAGSFSYAFFLTLKGYSISDFNYEKQQALLTGLTDATGAIGDIDITVRAGQAEGDLSLIIGVPAATEDDANRIKDAVSEDNFSEQLHQATGIPVHKIVIDYQQGYISAPEEGAEAPAAGDAAEEAPAADEEPAAKVEAPAADEPTKEPTEEPTAEPTEAPTHMPTPEPCDGGNHGCDETSTICVPSAGSSPASAIPARSLRRRLNTVEFVEPPRDNQMSKKEAEALAGAVDLNGDPIVFDGVPHADIVAAASKSFSEDPAVPATTSANAHHHHTQHVVKTPSDVATAEPAVSLDDIHRLVEDHAADSAVDSIVVEEPVPVVPVAVAEAPAAEEVTLPVEEPVAAVEEDAGSYGSYGSFLAPDIPHTCMCREGFVFDPKSSTSCIPRSAEAKKEIEAEKVGKISMVEMLIAGFCILVIFLGLIYYCRNRKSATHQDPAAAPKPDSAVPTWHEDGQGGWKRTNEAPGSPAVSASGVPLSSPLGASPSTNRWTAHDGNEYQATAI
jgi:hypothetical protein